MANITKSTDAEFAEYKYAPCLNSHAFCTHVPNHTFAAKCSSMHSFFVCMPITISMHFSGAVCGLGTEGVH